MAQQHVCTGGNGCPIEHEDATKREEAALDAAYAAKLANNKVALAKFKKWTRS